MRLEEETKVYVVIYEGVRYRRLCLEGWEERTHETWVPVSPDMAEKLEWKLQTL